jgi:hypothetical protein
MSNGMSAHAQCARGALPSSRQKLLKKLNIVGLGAVIVPPPPAGHNPASRR